MKAALLIVLSLSALAYAGPAFNKNANTNQIDANKAQQQHDQYMTTGDQKQTQSIEILKQWCFSSQMSQPELTSSFKKLVGVVKSSPQDQSTEAAVMSERICQGAIVQKSAQSGETVAQNSADAKAHELIKDVYMDALIACESRECMQQLIKIINSNKVDPIRASYYMTRVAVTEKASLKKDDTEAKQLAEDFISQRGQQTSEAVERQQLFAVTALLGKSLKTKVESKQQIGDTKQTVEQVVKTIVERYIKPVSQQEVQQYQQQQPQQQSSQVAKKIAKRSAALKAIANIPGSVLKECQGVEETLVEIAQNKQELSTARQSAIECLEQNDSALNVLKQITYDQQEPTEVRIAAYRALMTVAYAGMKDEQTKQQIAADIVSQVVKHCEDQRNQQNDDQFVLYAISHLDNLRTSQQPEHQAIKECIAKNKQHYMQIQLLCKKLQWDIRKSSRNYKLEQEFNQIESGLIIEGDLIYESKQKQQQRDIEILPKLVRVNMSMPVMGETVNVVEITLRQDQMDEELLGALKLVQGAKFNSESVSKVVDSFKSSAERKSYNAKTSASAEADLSIKVDGCTIIYLSLDDFKSSTESRQHQRNTRSAYGSYSIVDEIIEHLKRKPVAFNRGFNFNLNERLAKVLDVDANVIAGLRFDSRASGQSSNDFEIVAQMEPRFAFEAIVGPAKMSSKKLLQRFSTKTALGLRLKYKNNELVDVQLDLPMNTMELFTFETQLVEKSSKLPHSYTYLPESIYGQEDIYSPEEGFRARSRSQMLDASEDLDDEEQVYSSSKYANARKMKRSVFEKKSFTGKSLMKFMQGKESTIAHTYETSEKVARATGLRSKVRFVASPKDMSFYSQYLVEKYEPRMQGYRLQVQKVQRSQDSKQYIITASTPGSRVDRTMQVRVIKQSNSQRTVIKSDVQSPKMAATVQYELIHDGRQYAVKVDMASTRGSQWRHALECGLQRGSQSQSGRVATTYKPYLSIESTKLRRPVQLQGVVSYQQSPRTVISYELKSPTSGDYVQGKWIVDQRPSSPYYGKRSQRSMQSPIELLLQNDLTWTGELVGRVREHTFKLHQMIDWVSSKFAMNADLASYYKNERKSIESQYSANLKLDKDQQAFVSQYKSPQQAHKEYRLTVASDFRSPNGHQFVAECRYNGKRGQNQIAAYKHKIDFTQMSPKKADLSIVVELVDSSRQFSEKFVGRTQVGLERQMKTVQFELSNRNKNAKVNVEYVSLDQHQIEVVLQGERLSHRTQVRADQRQFSLQSRTEKHGQTLAKVVFELFKNQQGQCQLIVELPTKNTHVAFDLKPESGKLSSMAVQTPRFVSKAEFAFDSLSRGSNKYWMKPFTSNYRLKTDLKDMMNKQAYWMESAWNGDLNKKSYVRLDSPVYRTDLEYEPRDKSAKWGMFARSNKNLNKNFDQMYSSEDSILNEPFEANFATKLITKLPSNKLWMMRSAFSSPSKMEELKQSARRALFEYADRRQSQKHYVNWNPTDERINFAFERQPIDSSLPMRLTGDLSTGFTSFYNKFNSNNYNNYNKSYKTNQRPSTISMDSEFAKFDMEAKPFDGEECYARVQALSRSRRSAFKKHESEFQYKKNQGYKAYMKHQDSQDKHHQVHFESDESPKKWAKMAYQSDKHGKGEWEHKWRKNVAKRSHRNQDDEDVYANQIAFSSESPKSDWSHRSTFHWEEPTKMIAGGRIRRDVSDLSLVASEAKRNSRYTTLDYLKHINARLSSQTALKNQGELYNVDFDYQPEKRAHLQVSMPNEMLHSSSLEFEPTERLYKLQSRLINQRTKVPHYELQATSGKPVYGLATAEQEPVFIDEQHSMLDRPISDRLTTSLFRQPLKLDYSDKYGRLARLGYDQSPIFGDHYAGLRQKRAALYYKDESRDIEHDSTYDFYPEAVLGFKSAKRVPGDLSLKAITKYGPVKVHAESSADAVQFALESPVVNAKLVGETSSYSKRAGNSQLYKLYVDNKQQRVQLAKIVRQTPVINELEFVEKLAKKLDQSRMEHQTELLVNIVESIFKIKSQTMMDQRQVMVIEGEYNKAQEKAYAKINGKRTNGQLIVDLINKSANLVLDVDDKRTLLHQTRLVRVSDKFYSLESMTSYKQQPLFKLNGKVSSMIFSEPEHLFSRRSSLRSGEDHTSTFEAMLYRPKPYQISGQYDCNRKEARFNVKDLATKAVSNASIRFDDQTEQVYVNANTQSPRGISYSVQKAINVAPFVKVY